MTNNCYFWKLKNRTQPRKANSYKNGMTFSTLLTFSTNLEVNPDYDPGR